MNEYTVTTAQAAEALGLTRDAVIKACKRGAEYGLDAIKVNEDVRGGLWLIQPESVETYPQRRRSMRGQ